MLESLLLMHILEIVELIMLENLLVELVMDMLEIVVKQFVLLLICVLNHST